MDGFLGGIMVFKGFIKYATKHCFQPFTYYVCYLYISISSCVDLVEYS